MTFCFKPDRLFLAVTIGRRIMRGWRNRHTRMFEVHVVFTLRVQVPFLAPEKPRSLTGAFCCFGKSFSACEIYHPPMRTSLLKESRQKDSLAPTIAPILSFAKVDCFHNKLQFSFTPSAVHKDFLCRSSLAFFEKSAILLTKEILPALSPSGKPGCG